MASQLKPKNSEDEVHFLHLGLFLIGGLFTGSGLLSLYWAVGYAPGGLNEHLQQVGFNGVDNITTFGSASLSLALVVSGIMCLVIGNATAWRETGGY